MSPTAPASISGDVNQRALLTFAGIGIAVVLGVGAAVALSGFAKGDGRFAEVVRSFRAGMTMWAESRGGLGIFLLWTVALFAAQGLAECLAVLPPTTFEAMFPEILNGCQHVAPHVREGHLVLLRFLPLAYRQY